MPRTALPSAVPTWRIVELVADASPERSGGMSDRMTLASWAVLNPTPMPYTKNGTARVIPETVFDSSSVTPRIPTTSSSIPIWTVRRGSKRPASIPASGAATNEPAARVRKTRPVWNAL